MEGIERTTEKSSSRASGSKRGTPNKRWKAEYNNFLIPLLLEQVRKGLKCDKSFKRAAFVFAAVAVNSRFNTEFNAENVENHYRTLKMRYAEIKKVRDLSGSGWDDATKTITLDPMVALTYIEAHPAAKQFINKSIEHYEALRVICGEDSATGAYATFVFAEFGDNSEHEGNNMDNFEEGPIEHPSDDDADANSAPPVVSSPATSATPRSMSRHSRVGEMAAAIKNPTHWTKSLYAKVMEVDGFDKKELVQVFDFLQFREIEARGFIVKE
ncbi:Myb/SANT-like domain-containing protein, partial [Dioscorea alata]